MVITFFSILSFRHVYNVEINERDFIIPISFGFDIGGNYTFNIYNGSNDNILVHIGTIDDIKQYWIDKNGYDPCNVAVSNENIHIIRNQNSSFTGDINKAGVYTINVKSCAFFSSNYTIELIFLNPKSHLSSESQFYLNTFEKQLALMIFFFIIWTISNIMSHTEFNIFCLLITILLFLFIVNKTLLIYDYARRNQTDEISQISIIRPYFEYIYELFLYNTIVLTVSGYQFSYDEMPIIEFICNFLGCLVLVYLKNVLYFIIVLMIPFVFYLFLAIANIDENINAFIYFINFIVLLFHSLLTAFIRKKSLTRYDIQSILNNQDTFLLIFLSYQFHFREKMNSFCVNKIQSYFNESIDKLIKKTVVIPSHITRIDYIKHPFCDIRKVIFQNCSKLQIIGQSVFKSSYITTIKIPSSVVEICDYAFCCCNSLEIVEFEENSQLKIIGPHAFHNSAIEWILIPSSVTVICEYAFYNCDYLTNVEFEKNSQLQTIGIYAFANTSIVNIEIPSNVIFIESHTFDSCNDLVKVTFSENSKLKIISGSAFSNSSIRYLEIPSKVCLLENYWCFNTLFLTSVNVSPENEYYENDGEYIVKGKKSNNNDNIFFVSRDMLSMFIPSFIKHIGTNSFSNGYIRYVHFNNDSQLSVIHSDAFCCSLIEYFSFPATVTTIENRAFGYCKKLMSVYFPNNSQLQIIEDEAFTKTFLYTVLIPSKVKYIGKNAFSECKKLFFVEFQNDSELKVIDDMAFKGTSLIQISIPPHVIKIGNLAFIDCQQLQIIEISEKSQLKSLSNNIINEFSFTIIMIPSELHICII